MSLVEKCMALATALEAANKIISQQADEMKKISDALDISREYIMERSGRFAVAENRLSITIYDLQVEIKRRDMALQHPEHIMPSVEEARLVLLKEDELKYEHSINESA